MNLLEPYHQAYTYDTGNNLTHLIHQAPSSTWQQTLSIHPASNQGAESPSPTTNFDPNGNLLTLNHIGTLTWHYNNSLNKLTKDDKTTEYYIYDYQGTRTRTVTESNQQKQSQRDYLPALDILTTTQQSTTLHIGTHILSETTQNTIQARYQLTSHLQSNTLELNDKAQVVSFEHFYPYGGTTLITGNNQTQVKQKRYRYTSKETNDSSSLSYHSARYLAPWIARWINPDSLGAINSLNLYTYVNNNPLKYTDPTGHVRVYEMNKLGVYYKLDLLAPATHTADHSKHLFYLPKAYQRIEDIVRNYSTDDYHLLDTGTTFFTNPMGKNPSKIEASAFALKDPYNSFKNTMDFSTGELTFDVNYRTGKVKIDLNATEVICYQYIGISKIAGAQYSLPKTFLRSNISNDIARLVMKRYQQTNDYPQFFYDFINNTNNGRHSLRVADTWGLEITHIQLDKTSVRLFLQPQTLLKPLGKTLLLPSEHINEQTQITKL